MHRFIKKIIVGFTCITIAVSSFGSAFAMPTLLHEDKNTKNLSGGVVHEHIKQFHASGWWNINVLRVDLKDEYTKVGAIFNQNGISKRDTVTNMMKGTDAVGGINADYFEMNNNASPFGPTVADGEIISSPKYNDGSKLPAFVIDKNNNPIMDYWKWTMDLVAPAGNKFAIAAINKPTSSEYSLSVFNDKWGKAARGNSNTDIADIIVNKDGIVTQVRVNQPAVSVPKGHQVISGRKFGKNFLLSHFPKGTKINIQTTGNIDFDNIEGAVGGGSFLLKNGVRTKADINIAGNHPRTAIGISKDKKELIMVTVDGRNNVFSGVSMPVLAGIMKHLGAHDAMNLDGGGSTTMATKGREDKDAKVVNILSGGVQRQVINGLGVFDSAPIGELHRLELSTDNKNTFNNNSRTITAVGYDKHQHKVNINPNDIVFTVEEDKGSFEKNKFTPTSTGKITVKADLKGALGEMEINVLEELKELKFTKDKIGVGLSGKHNMGDIYGIDRKGIRAKLNASDINWTTIGDIGKIENGVFQATDKPASGALVAKLNGAVKTILVSVGLDNKPVNNLDSLDGITTSSYPSDLVGGNVALDNDAKVGTHSLKLNYDFTKTDKTRAFYIKLGSGMKLEAKPSAIGLWIDGKNDKTWVRGDLVDAKGVEHKIDFANSVDWDGWKNVSAQIPSNVTYPVTLKSVYVAQTDPKNKAVGQMKIDGISGLYPKDINIDPSELPGSSVFKDDDNVHSQVEEGGYKFTIASAANTVNFKKTLAENKFSYILGALNPNMTTGIKSNVISLDKGFKIDVLGSTKFIKVDNTKAGIRTTNSDQWLSMKPAIENAKEKNIVLMLPKSIYSFKDKMEQDIFLRLIDEYSEMGKNMHVVYGGNKTEMTLKDGVKYFEVNSNQAGSGFGFVVNGERLTYQIVK